MRGAALYQQSGELSGPRLRPIGKPRSSRADRAKARDVRKAPTEVGTSARHAAIRRDAPLSVLVQVRAGRSDQMSVEMFTKRRLEWAKPLDLPQFENMPS